MAVTKLGKLREQARQEQARYQYKTKGKVSEEFRREGRSPKTDFKEPDSGPVFPGSPTPEPTPELPMSTVETPTPPATVPPKPVFTSATPIVQNQSRPEDPKFTSRKDVSGDLVVGIEDPVKQESKAIPPTPIKQVRQVESEREVIIKETQRQERIEKQKKSQALAGEVKLKMALPSTFRDETPGQLKEETKQKLKIESFAKLPISKKLELQPFRILTGEEAKQLRKEREKEKSGVVLGLPFRKQIGGFVTNTLSSPEAGEFISGLDKRVLKGVLPEAIDPGLQVVRRSGRIEDLQRDISILQNLKEREESLTAKDKEFYFGRSKISEPELQAKVFGESFARVPFTLAEDPVTTGTAIAIIAATAGAGAGAITLPTLGESLVIAGAVTGGRILIEESKPPIERRSGKIAEILGEGAFTATTILAGAGVAKLKRSIFNRTDVKLKGVIRGDKVTAVGRGKFQGKQADVVFTGKGKQSKLFIRTRSILGNEKEFIKITQTPTTKLTQIFKPKFKIAFDKGKGGFVLSRESKLVTSFRTDPGVQPIPTVKQFRSFAKITPLNLQEPLTGAFAQQGFTTKITGKNFKFEIKDLFTSEIRASPQVTKVTKISDGKVTGGLIDIQKPTFEFGKGPRPQDTFTLVQDPVFKTTTVVQVKAPTVVERGIAQRTGIAEITFKDPGLFEGIKVNLPSLGKSGTFGGQGSKQIQFPKITITPSQPTIFDVAPITQVAIPSSNFATSFGLISLTGLTQTNKNIATTQTNPISELDKSKVLISRKRIISQPDVFPDTQPVLRNELENVFVNVPSQTPKTGTKTKQITQQQQTSILPIPISPINIPEIPDIEQQKLISPPPLIGIPEIPSLGRQPKSSEKFEGFDIPNKFIPSLSAISFGIEGDVDEKRLFTGLEFRPIPKKRKRKRAKKK